MDADDDFARLRNRVGALGGPKHVRPAKLAHFDDMHESLAIERPGSRH